MTCDRRTFHSRPSCSAVVDRFDEPTYAVENPESRWNSHALACSRVRSVSQETWTSAPSGTSSSSALRSVEPR